MGPHDVGEEPDPRYTLANERTFLAWVRTSLAVLAGAVALHSVDVPEQDALRTTLVVGLVLVGGVSTALAYRRWVLVERAMRTRRPLPRSGLGAVLAGTVLLASLLLAAALVAT